MEVLVQWFTDNLSQFISSEMVIFIISMVPILELRGGLLAASLLKIPAATAIPICIIGNIIPIPFILLFIRQIFKLMKKTKIFHGLIEKLENRAMGKSDQIKKYEFWGLMLFVGIPLPGTGAWTGALVASLLHMKFGKAFGAILVGIALATVIMSILSYGVLGVLFMIPLRQALIVKEHGVLPYPEGQACAEVLIAGEQGGSKAGVVFAGMGIAALYKFVADG